MKILSLIAATTFCLLVITGCEQPATDTAAPATQTTPAPTSVINTELQQRITAGEAPVILDVRSADEYAGGHIAGAVNIAHTDIATQVDALPADRTTEIVVHCHSGGRATAAEATLTELGYTNVRHLEGDYAGWEAAGLPLE